MRQERTPTKTQRHPVAGIEVVAHGTQRGRAVTKMSKRIVLLSILLHLALAVYVRVDQRAVARASRSRGIKGDSP
ncbi:MAG: hypothetical protein ABFD77_10130 [Thermotogota bacterium]